MPFFGGKDPDLAAHIAECAVEKRKQNETLERIDANVKELGAAFHGRIAERGEYHVAMERRVATLETQNRWFLRILGAVGGAIPVMLSLYHFIIGQGRTQ